MSEKPKSIGLLHLSNVRASYLYCFEPFKGKPTPQNPKPKDVYTCHFLLPPDHPDLRKVAETIEAVGAAHRWRGDIPWTVIKESLKAQDKLCLHKGDVSKAGKPEYAGLYYVSGNNYNRFTVVDGARNPMSSTDPMAPRSGDYINAIIDIYPQDNDFGRRINATITGIQMVRRSDAFGGGAAPAAPEEFGIVATSADEALPAASQDVTGGLL